MNAKLETGCRREASANKIEVQEGDCMVLSDDGQRPYPTYGINWRPDLNRHPFYRSANLWKAESGVFLSGLGILFQGLHRNTR